MQNRSSQQSETIEQRIAALESRYGAIERELDDIRAVISSGFDVLFTGNSNKTDAIRAICDRLDAIEEQVTPAFFKVFPRQREFLEEIDTVLRRNPGDAD
jgi:hypothetical protein